MRVGLHVSFSGRHGRQTETCLEGQGNVLWASLVFVSLSGVL